MADSPDKLRQELADLRARAKPQGEWTGSDWLDQRAIAQRIRILESNLGSEVATKEN